MTQVIAKYAARKMLNSSMEKYKDKAPADEYDPFYEYIDHPRKPGKKKKVKKQIPAWIPEHDANILAKARKSAYRLDCCLFNFLGVRFGWSSVIGFVPVAGDAADFALAGNLVKNMSKVDGGLPRGTFLMMLLNILMDFFVGLIPFVGDLIDAAFRANSKNVRLLEEHLDKKYKPQELVDDDRRQKRHPRPATVYEDFSDDEYERTGVIRDGRDDRDAVRQPARAHSARRDRIADEEMGYDRSDRRDDRPSRNNTRSSRR
ncbi:uncharacterized protein CC84DRAFT_1169914 [Paraphaeosphaeria sporulosa]|uniref:PH domain-containing protein n=1 Tax=Paraphaeosphaeria sporulosa TaxID=1460663 RepID=A0A177BUE8_9PLEO|nr:uncharacterized protein CC84DRAFT_1169914 [Paraphaeosphaeria sporulosa]OAF98765.1 hypothetical protein CC84DRAFT_1169914 [Paraphaeosphaeria sporulosa]